MAEMDTAEVIESLVTDAIHWQQIVSPAPDATKYEVAASGILDRILGGMDVDEREFVHGITRHLIKQAETLRVLRDRLDGSDQALVDLVESPELRKVFKATVVGTLLGHGKTFGSVSLLTDSSEPSHQQVSVKMQLPPIDMEDWACGQRYEVAVVER